MGHPVQSGQPFFLAVIDRTLLLSNYLGDSFPQTEQTEQPPKSELPSHPSLGLGHSDDDDTLLR